MQIVADGKKLNGGTNLREVLQCRFFTGSLGAQKAGGGIIGCT